MTSHFGANVGRSLASFLALGTVRPVSGLSLSEALIFPLRSGRNTIWINVHRAEQLLGAGTLEKAMAHPSPGNRTLRPLCNLRSAQATGCAYVRVGYAPHGTAAWAGDPVLELTRGAPVSCCC